MSATHETDQKNYFGNDVARLYSPITKVEMTRTDATSTNSYTIVENGQVVLSGYDSVTLNSGALYQTKLDELALRIKTTVTFSIGAMGGDNYQYLEDTSNLIPKIAG